MPIDPVWFALEQIKRVIESLGWRMTATETTGDIIKFSAEKPRKEIVK